MYYAANHLFKTTDYGHTWQTISPDLTGAGAGAQGKTEGPVTVENAKERGYGVVFTIAPSKLNRNLIWAGSDTGLIHVTRDGGKTWKDVTPRGLTAWSKLSMIEASRFDPAVAYAAVDRSRLDDQTPYLYRTRDYGATWQAITEGVAGHAFLRAIREDTEKKGLLFAGTETGVYVSFDDGDHWQPLQLNLPMSSMRDLTIHGDDLVVATHGRSFWILDNIAPLRQAAEARKADGFWLYHPATAVRVDNDFFAGTPLPPEEPTAENPPSGAMIDYFLKSGTGNVTLEIFDGQGKLVSKYSLDVKSDVKSDVKHSEKQPSLPIAERWLPKPEGLEKTPGMHRFVWNLAWGNVEANADEDYENRNPSGPKVVPGNYQVRLTVDGRVQNRMLKVVMDPRCTATPAILQRQLELGLTMFAEAREARRALGEIGSVRKELTGVQQKIGGENAALSSAVAEALAEVSKIVSNKGSVPWEPGGLQDAFTGLASALRAVESGDREVPAQAIDVYRESSERAKAGIAAWEKFKQTKLRELNQKLQEGNVDPVTVSAVEADLEVE